MNQEQKYIAGIINSHFKPDGTPFRHDTVYAKRGWLTGKWSVYEVEAYGSGKMIPIGRGFDIFALVDSMGNFAVEQFGQANTRYYRNPIGHHKKNRRWPDIKRSF